MDMSVCSDSIEKDVPEERDVRKKQSFGKWQTLILAYESIGVIYGDIGTSPLYVFSSTFSESPSHDDLLGATSLIIWSLTIMVTIKYILIVLLADDEGEGGTFALYSLLSRYAKILQRDMREERMVQMQRYQTDEMHRPNSSFRALLETSSVAQWFLKVVGVFGVALLLADGVLTPAQSLLGAIQGATVVNPSVDSSTVIGISCAIIVLVYALQPFGTGRLAVFFAPIVILWLIFNLSFGIYNLVHYDASVFKAVSPYFAGAFLVRNGRDGWLALGGILLAFTGVEALFADLGAFSRGAIQISWCCFAYPCLLIGYIGQAAYISHTPSAWSNPFYLTVPPGMLWPSLILAILACIVASQAVITGAFQLLSQIMKLSYFPQIKVIHMSKQYYGQVYIPFANWILMIGTVVVTAVYTNTTNLGHAYGVCVILVTFLTTCMVTLVAVLAWRLPVYLVMPVFVVFALWDGMFLSAAMTKIPHGAWVTLMIAGVLTAFFVLWRYGKEEQWRAESADYFPLSGILSASRENHQLHLCAEKEPTKPIISTHGLGIFFDKPGSPAVAPPVLAHFLNKFTAAPEFIVLFHLRPLQVPTIPLEDRYQIVRCYASESLPTDASSIPTSSNSQRVVLPNCFRFIVRYGYTDDVITPNLGQEVAENLRRFLVENGETAALQSLERAYAAQVVYIVGKEQLRIRRGSGILRWLILSVFLWVRGITARKVQALNVPVDRLVEVGFVKDI
ncbi:hypothetical protein ASPZODRAFT_22244 [Penicilliopsis zonata CBS 506.65]|uniref:Potassium transporter n=1 Tax=Penicilliopsis zonata CBS 506.65 TaxID=1073090 RepID=A0A1L9SX99_9EURO|nr:hypothetical protein ASPZODRAFT_22244 [Penicilliopsis zonata CBS 506.65]OJJ51822.1 hypothetical protein ASPZODRAFT_22244 [Penicilliopsis zonata CBS 506.65]